MVATVKKLKYDVNGNRRYQYNFIDANGIKQNEKFSWFGRKTKNGISTQLAPFQIIDWLKTKIKEDETSDELKAIYQEILKNGFTEI